MLRPLSDRALVNRKKVSRVLDRVEPARSRILRVEEVSWLRMILNTQFANAALEEPWPCAIPAAAAWSSVECLDSGCEPERQAVAHAAFSSAIDRHVVGAGDSRLSRQRP